MSQRKKTREERLEAQLVAAELAEDRLAEFKALLALGRLAVRTTESGTRICLVPWCNKLTSSLPGLCLVPSCDACTAAIGAGWVKLRNPSAVARERYCVTHASQALYRAVRVPKHLR